MRKIRTIVALLLAALVAACASRDSTVDTATARGTIYRLSETDALALVWQSIHDAMPGRRITEYRGARKGYWIEFYFGFDSYGITATVVPGVGTDAAGNPVTGHYFEVTGAGSSFLQGRAKAAEIFDIVKRAADATGTQMQVSGLRGITRIAGGDTVTHLPDVDPLAEGGTAAGAGTATATATAVPLAATIPSAARATQPDSLAQLRYSRPTGRSDDVAVIIGNAAYDRLGRDLPPVPPAKADAAAMRRYAIEGLGVAEDNIITLEDATGAKLIEVFGNERDHRGTLYNWIKPGRSRVFVYYAGHGAPAGEKGTPMLVPTDASASQIALSGYPLATLYANLAKLPTTGVTVVLEACFSGQSQAGTLVPAASPVSLAVKESAPPSTLTVIAAGAANQIASWRRDRGHGLLTEYFLRGEAGEADQPPYGDGDGKVGLDELERYLKDKVATQARREWGRDQNVQVFRPGAK